MNKISFKLKHCYGINKLNFELNFNESNTNIIYASNGTMKTSFADTMKSLSNEIIPFDRIENVSGIADVVVDDSRPINKDEILVIEAEKINDNMEENTSLLASKELKKEYDNIYNSINKKLKEFEKKIKQTSGFSSNEFYELCRSLFLPKSKNILEVFEYIYKDFEIDDYKNEDLQKIKYKEIFNNDTEKLFNTSEFISLISEYVEKYNEIFSNSQILVKGKFNYYNAEVVSKNLNDNGYFDAGHKIKLKNSKLEISDSKKFNELVENEKNKELQDVELKKRFNKIDEMLKSTVGVRNLKEYLINNREILHYLQDICEFKKNIVLNYILMNKDEFDNLMLECALSKDKIKDILGKAKNEVTVWQDVKEVFKRRFYVPFDVILENKEDVILKEERLSLIYVFGKNNIKVSKDNMLNCLSTGERKAYYILNLLYELEKAKRANKEIFVVIDDLADSFDYRNKYAIVEYLYDFQKNPKFKIVILTHNFDFYRTVSNRLNLKGKQAFFAEKNEDEICIENGKYFENIFFKWKNQVYSDKKIFIASIPFIRNISEYIKGRNKNYIYSQLTNILHIKQIDTDMNIENNIYKIKSTNDIWVDDIKKIYKSVWKIDDTKIKYQNLKIKDLIFQVADEIERSINDNNIFLENKIVLSIAIRLKAEMYMIKRINDDKKVNLIDKNQTRKLFDLIDWNHKEDINIKKTLTEVLLMTSENIHLNSFMYEPIIDMSIENLKYLYKEISEIIEKLSKKE